MRTIKRFRGRRVHTTYREVKGGQPTNNLIVVYKAPKGHQRQREIVPETEYEAGTTIDRFDGHAQ